MLPLKRTDSTHNFPQVFLTTLFTFHSVTAENFKWKLCIFFRKNKHFMEGDLTPFECSYVVFPWHGRLASLSRCKSDFTFCRWARNEIEVPDCKMKSNWRWNKNRIRCLTRIRKSWVQNLNQTCIMCNQPKAAHNKR